MKETEEQLIAFYSLADTDRKTLLVGFIEAYKVSLLTKIGEQKQFLFDFKGHRDRYFLRSDIETLLK